MNDTLESRARQIYERFLQRASRDDEFNDWAGYRAELTDYIIRKTTPGSSLLILGAGKCNDLDLQKLAEHCGSITLSDYRPETAEEAFRQYGLEPLEQLGSAESSEQLESAQLESAARPARLRFACADYVGITDEDYIEYTAKLLGIMQKLAGAAEKLNGATEQPDGAAGSSAAKTRGSSLEEIAGPQLIELRQTLEQIYERNAAYRIDLGGETYDYAVVAGVHSQLNNSFRGLFQYVKKDVEDNGGAENSRDNGGAGSAGSAGAQVLFADELNTFVFQTTREHTGDLVDRFNKAVFAAVKDGVIYGFEKSIIYNIDGTGPMIGTVDGARQAGEAIAELPAEDPWGCLWPLSRRRGIKFEMAICYLPMDKLTS